VFSQSRQAHIASEDAEDMFQAGATICLTRVEGASEAFASLIESTRAELHFSGDVSIRAYWSPPRGGFGPHFDARVVTTLQVHGRKRWWFSETPVEVLPIGNRWLSDDPRAALEGQPVRSVTLDPGDVLCLPPGIVHWANAETESLSYNIGLDYVDATVADLLTGALCEELLADPEFRLPLFGDMATPEPMLAVMRKACLAASDALIEASKRPELLLDVWKRAVAPDED
jgi:ribosomal protein L16 Arg81 hydroxylase